jgi:spore maturation protein CgeB
VDPACTAAAPIPDPGTGRLADVRLTVGGKTRHLCGRAGEDALVRAVREAVRAGETPVFVGFGLGRGPAEALALGAPAAAVVDREDAILAATLAASGLAADPRLAVFSGPDPDKAAEAALAALPRSPGRRVAVIEHPGYLRLDRAYYGRAAARLRAGAAFARRTGYPKFAGGTPRVLVAQGDYFLQGEIDAALRGLGVAARGLSLPDLARGSTAFVESLLTAVTEFRPDFLLTVNHLGLDREGRLMGLLADLELPLASWFVDSPRLILHDFPRQADPWCAVFTWDRDTAPDLSALGFADPVFLPLATDPDRFRPPRPGDAPLEAAFAADVSFVGSSMVRQVREPLDRLAGFPELVRDYAALAGAFARAPRRDVAGFLAEARPDLHARFMALPDSRARLDFELLVTWEATRQYRTRCVRALLPFAPSIAGDRHWAETLPASPPWRHLPPLNYYRDLPGFYPGSKVSLNCTSMQMKGAVNQRVFDIPACGGFVLTDRREQLSLAFDPDETACYDDPGEITDLARHYLAHPDERRRIADRARRRILAEHTYRHRLATLIEAMRRRYS